MATKIDENLSRKRGKWGEGIALEFLLKKGYTTVATGFRSRFGEIDIIVKNKEFLVFAEVKTRKNANFAYAREYVSKVKQRKIISTANYWLIKRPAKLQPLYCRPRYSANYKEDVLKTALPDILKNWAVKGSSDLSVILPEGDLAKINDFFNTKLKGELSKGLELKSNRKLTNGFLISNKEGSAYYDFSSEAVCELLSTYLNPKLAEVLKSALKGI